MGSCSGKECGQGEACSPAWACLLEGGNLGLDLKRYAQGALAWVLGVGCLFVHWSEGGGGHIWMTLRAPARGTLPGVRRFQLAKNGQQLNPKERLCLTVQEHPSRLSREFSNPR